MCIRDRSHAGVVVTTSVAPAALSLAGVGAAMIGVLWAYEGWQYVTFSAGETRDHKRCFLARSSSRLRHSSGSTSWRTWAISRRSALLGSREASALRPMPSE